MAHPSTVPTPTVLYSPAEPDGRLFQAGEPWPGDAWSANRGGEPVGKGATKQAMQDLIAAQDTIDGLSAQLGSKDHDLGVLATERDAAVAKVAELEARAIDAEKLRDEAEARAREYMVERDQARAEAENQRGRAANLEAALAEATAPKKKAAPAPADAG